MLCYGWGRSLPLASEAGRRDWLSAVAKNGRVTPTRRLEKSNAEGEEKETGNSMLVI